MDNVAGGQRLIRLSVFRQPEVQHLDAGLVHHDVAGLQVAMNDPFRVRRRNGVGYLHAVAEH